MLLEALRPERINEIAQALLDLGALLRAESGNQSLRPVFDRTERRSANPARKVEEVAPLLASVARAEYRLRSCRDNLFGDDLFGEPAWDMLLDLFIQMAEGKNTSVTSLCIASRAPTSTALRYINVLEKRGMIVRTKSSYDQRTYYVSLSDETFAKMGTYLKQRAFGSGQLVRQQICEPEAAPTPPQLAPA